MSKVGKRKTISFAVGNLDVYDLIDEQPNGSQYICDAIRFYEKYKDTIENQQLQGIGNFDQLIAQKVEELLIDKQIKGQETLIKKDEPVKEDIEEDAITNINKISNRSLDAIKNFYFDQDK